MISTSIARTRWAAIGAAVAITLGAVGIGSLNIANADVSSGDRPVFIPINPCRLLDTRPGTSNVGPKTSPLGPKETFTATAHGSNGQCTGASAIPTDALSLSLNVTAIGPTQTTFLTFWGAGANPGTSNLNPSAGSAPTPNAVNTPVSPSGTFNIFNNAGNVNVIVDVNGYYANHNHDDRYPLKGDVYTKAQADALLADTGADTTPVNIYSFTFTDAGNWTTDGVPTHRPGATDCTIAPVDLPEGRNITGITMTYFAPTGADVRVSLQRATNLVGMFSNSEEVLKDLFGQTTVTIPATASTEIGRATFSLPAPTVARASTSYQLAICTASNLGVVNVVVDTPTT